MDLSPQGSQGPVTAYGDLLLVVGNFKNLSSIVAKISIPCYGIYISDDTLMEYFEDIGGRPDDPSVCGVCASQVRGSARCV